VSLLFSIWSLVLVLKPDLVVCVTLLQAVSFSATILRLFHRWRTNRLWWDDYVLLLPFVADVLLVILTWTTFGSHRTFSPSVLLVLSSGLTCHFAERDLTGKFFHSDWFSAFLYFTVVW